mgnify:CR=1 FL=1
MKKTLAQQLRTNIKMRMAELDLTGEQVYIPDFSNAEGV